MRDYLHFLYIARASLTEAQYLLHLALRLRFVSESEHAPIAEHVKQTFGLLHGLVKAVENEAGVVRRMVALTTSFLFLAIGRAALGPVVR